MNRLLASAVFCFLLFSAIRSPAAVVEGIVLSPSGPVADSRVTAYPDFDSLAGNRNAAFSEPGDKPGHFRFDLDPGRYYFVARGNESGVPLFSYHGLNPITITSEYHWLPLFAVAATEAECIAGPTGLEGTVIHEDAPLTSGAISVYDAGEGRFRGMGLLTSSLDDTGGFRFDLEPGRYVVVARQRRGGGALGPLRKGDLFCFPAANPVELQPGRRCRLVIFCYPRDDMTAFLEDTADDPRGPREPRRRTASLRDTLMGQTGVDDAVALAPTMLSGTVKDVSGRPLPGLYISAYPASDRPLFQMHIIRQITDYMARSDQAGTWRLQLPPGVYYLVARQRLGEAPSRHEYYGLYENSSNHSLLVAPGRSNSGVQIVADRIMPERDEEN